MTPPGADAGGLRGVQLPATPSPSPDELNTQPLTLISPAAGGLQTDPTNLTFTWTPHPRARWYRLRVENGAGKALLVRRFDDPAAICTESLCTVQVADADGALKDGRRYRWLVAAKVAGREALRRTEKLRFTLNYTSIDRGLALPPREIAFTNFMASQVQLKSTAGSDTSGFPRNGTLPVWSLTGNELAYVNPSAQIALYDFRTASGSTVGGNPNAVIPQIKDTYWDPVWSPDGGKIAFVLSSDLAASSDRVDIFVMDADGNNILNLTAGLATQVHVLPAWSPDGTQLAISASASGNDFDIFIISAVDGSLIATVTDDNFPDGAPFWSVNGDKLAFLSPTNPDCLPFCVANADGSDVDTFSPLPPPAGNADPLDWGAVWLPTGDYAFARLTLTPSLTSALYLHSGGSDQLLFNDGWFPKWRPSMDETLLVYGVEVGELAVWNTTNYLPELGPGIEVVARALSSLNATYSSSESPHVVFRRVLINGVGNERIVFVLDPSLDNCITHYNFNGYVAYIECSSSSNAPFTEFTAAHELGHVLAARTGGQQVSAPNGLYGLVDFPQRSGPYPTVRAGNRRVFGRFTWSVADPADPNSIAEFPDWERGNRGWGSGAVSYSDPKWSERLGQGILPPPDFVWVGPCGNAATEVPTNFQQNPCYLKNWVVQNRTIYNPEPPQLAALTDEEIGKLAGIEIEETAADMFLNWSYRRLNLGGLRIWNGLIKQTPSLIRPATFGMTG